MAHIKIEEENNMVRLQIDGSGEDLSSLLAQAIIKEPVLAVMFLNAIDIITKTQDNPFENINLN